MPHPDPFDWSTSTAEEHLLRIRTLPAAERRARLLAYDWRHHPEAVFGWAMAQRGVDLATALCVFFRGGPARFNYLPKREVPEAFRGTARALDNICQRINSGFYLASPDGRADCPGELVRWVEFQRADRAEARRGRWIIEEGVVEPLLARPSVQAGRTVVRTDRVPSLLRDLLSPVIGLGVDRDVLKYRDGGK